MWSRTVVLTRMVDDVAKYKRDQAKYAAEKQERIAKQIESNGKADARTVKGRAAKIMTPSKYRKVNRTGFHDGLGGLDNGLFTIAAAKRHKGHHIAPDTPIVSIDPGLKNIMTCATSTLDDMDPQPGRSLSLGEYYDRIGNRSYRFRVNKGKRKAGVDAAELAMSQHSLRTTDYDALLVNLRIHAIHATKILSYYGSRNHARARFRIRQQRDRFFSTIADEIAPDKNTVIALGDGQFAATINGLASCPIAKVVETLARKRRVVYVPEYNTTKRCSYCKSPDAVTKGAKSDQTMVSASGHEYHVPIHGLRHCTSRGIPRDALHHV